MVHTSSDGETDYLSQNEHEIGVTFIGEQEINTFLRRVAHWASVVAAVNTLARHNTEAPQCRSINFTNKARPGWERQLRMQRITSPRRRPSRLGWTNLIVMAWVPFCLPHIISLQITLPGSLLCRLTPCTWWKLWIVITTWQRTEWTVSGKKIVGFKSFNIEKILQYLLFYIVHKPPESTPSSIQCSS